MCVCVCVISRKAEYGKRLCGGSRTRISVSKMKHKKTLSKFKRQQNSSSLMISSSLIWHKRKESTQRLMQSLSSLNKADSYSSVPGWIHWKGKSCEEHSTRRAYVMHYVHGYIVFVFYSVFLYFCSPAASPLG